MLVGQSECRKPGLETEASVCLHESGFSGRDGFSPPHGAFDAARRCEETLRPPRFRWSIRLKFFTTRLNTGGQIF